MDRTFRIKVRMRRFRRQYPRIAFAIRSFMIFSATFGGAYGFVSGSRSETSGYDPNAFAIGVSFLFALACLGLAILLVMIAHLLQARRDFGMGIIPPTPGPARGGVVANVWGLALRLNLGSVISWTIAFAVLGMVFGFVASSLGDVFASNPDIAHIIAVGGATSAGLVYLFLLTLLKVMGMIAAVYGVQVVMRIPADRRER